MRLRDLVDYIWFQMNKETNDKEDANTLAARLRIVPRQAQFIQELNTLQQIKFGKRVLGANILLDNITEIQGWETCDHFKDFRLRVKRRLLKEDKELQCLPKVLVTTNFITKFVVNKLYTTK